MKGLSGGSAGGCGPIGYSTPRRGGFLVSQVTDIGLFTCRGCYSSVVPSATDSSIPFLHDATVESSAAAQLPLNGGGAYIFPRHSCSCTPPRALPPLPKRNPPPRRVIHVHTPKTWTGRWLHIGHRLVRVHERDNLPLNLRPSSSLHRLLADAVGVPASKLAPVAGSRSGSG